MYKQYGIKNYQRYKKNLIKSIFIVRDLIYFKNQIDIVNLKIVKYIGNLNNMIVVYKY